ncbi:nuclear transport factor 2 family protein [Defluviimonas sp. WL0002]|uniref:Nuclear transport factor 2 family protein n=1 Tax=Albidovulum marisflavi TaxID=2984159 RepID=A0ABT2ZF44_9RHOB|nr:nuclear transport factor 2 family protein [Defluviimonas sp. WL0002]MCV2869719.1 nuclear transport factor 2 family protein [Defluviimonas sp. WL0002]
MTLQDPADFPRAFSHAFSSRDLATITGLFTADADFLSLTGAWAEGHEAIEQVLSAELAGTLARVRLVSGRTKMRPVAPGVAQAMQRFVLSGLSNPDGSDAGRIGAVLSALLVQTHTGWRVVSAQFSAEG